MRDSGIDITGIDPRRIYSFAQMARLTGMSPTTFYRWRDIGRLQVFAGQRSKTFGRCFIAAIKGERSE